MRNDKPFRARNPDASTSFDMLGIGFGPANLALAIALREQARGQQGGAAPPRYAFLERKPEFGWHRGMLLDDATMQVSFLKDLATLRNPQSRFTFVNFLHEHGRLQDFINFKSFYPLRIEFHDYLSWAAEQCSRETHYHQDVSSIEPHVERASLRGFVVRCGNGTVRTTRDIVLAAGLRPSVPSGVALGKRVWHSSQLLGRLAALEAEGDEAAAEADMVPSASSTSKREREASTAGVEPASIAVIGGGQSAAEVIALLHQRFAGATIHAIHSRLGFAPSDSSPFVNQIFDDTSVTLHHESPPEVRAKLLQDHRNTNYSVVDEDLILQLYRLSYRERLKGTERLRFHPLSRVEGAEERSGHVDMEISRLAAGVRESLRVDIAIFATGYRSVSPADLLPSARELCAWDSEGNLEIDAKYRVRMRVPGNAAMYVQGATEHSHGIGSTLLSNVAHRAQVIADELLEQHVRQLRVGADASLGADNG